MTVCVACNDAQGGCERCRGGPGEQGYTLDEQELLQLRDRVRELEQLRDEHVEGVALTLGLTKTTVRDVWKRIILAKAGR
jgi:hypothetical protein